ncbi:MAG: Rpn family recombination-promoting nuclease/putative transposase [Clostridiales Family XIII bacterium]|jgi:predicted transposase/invertase (TIGR01784 family)|nr:Rpn family recombination-promoting nuclease/putative transposase [Clostridiales Family XIII bacterium]
MTKSILPVKNDYVFKRIFGDVNNTDILAGFLKSVLDIPEGEYEHLEISDPYLLPDKKDGKVGVLDVKVYTTHGKVIDIEIQVEDKIGFKERIVSYTSRMINNQLVRGTDYTIIEKVISIVIADFVLIDENDEYHNKFVFHDPKTGTTFTDIIEINTLELGKLPDENDLSDLWDWMKFICVKEEDAMAELDKIAERNPQIKKAVGVLRQLSEDEQERELAWARERAIMDKRAEMMFAEAKGEARGKAEGKAEGIAEGEIKGKLETARNMKDKGYPISDIAEITVLSVEEIDKL